MPRYPPIAAPPCAWCGEPGWHGTTEECLTVLRAGLAAEQLRIVTAIAAAQRVATRREQAQATTAICRACGDWRALTRVPTSDSGTAARPVDPPRARRVLGPRPAWPELDRSVIARATKAAIVDEMLLAGPGAIVATAHQIARVRGLKPGTIVNSWRRWAQERDR